MKHLHAETGGRVDSPAGTIRVVRHEAQEDTRWDEFVARCPEATFFHQSAFRALIANQFGHRTHYLRAERGGQVCGVLPLVEVKSLLFGHSFSALPFAVYGGCAADDEESARALHAEAAAIAQASGASHLELRNRSRREPGWPEQDLYVTFRKALDADVEANMLAIPRKQRAMVRKGIKAGLTSVVDPGVDRFFDLYADNMHRHGTPPFPRRWFVALKEAFGERCEALIVLDPAGRPVSGVLSFYFRDEVLPYYAGDLECARDTAANDFKYWELMRRACERGVKVFDYGRSKRGTGSFDFKKNWGFEPQPLHYEYRLFRSDRIPENNPLNPKYQLFIRAWRRLPRPLVNAIGPWLSRNLG